MADDKNSGSGGFDDWLDEDVGPATDPYRALSQDDPAEDVADWVAFTEGQDASSNEDAAGEPVVTDSGSATGNEPDAAEPDTGEMEAIASPPGDAPVASVAEGSDEPTSEIDLPYEAPDEITLEHTVAGGFREDEATEEVAAVISISDQPDDEPDDADGEGSVFAGEVDADHLDAQVADTGELDILAAVSTDGVSDSSSEGGLADIWDQDYADPVGESTGTPESNESAELSEEGYLANATREHTNLAEAIAIAEEQDTAQVAVASVIPGLAESVVGFEDVVEAEGLSKAKARSTGDLAARVITALALVGAFAASLVWQPVFVAFASVVFVISAGEFYTSLVRSEHKPIAFFGFVGIVGASLGAFAWGALAIPIAFFVAATLLLLFYAVVPGKADPMGNLALTLSVMVWVGLGTFAMLIADSTFYRPLVVAVVVTVAVMDIVQYFAGRAFGRTPLSPWVSPNKTVEGLVAGVVVALGVGASLHFVQPFELTSGLALGLIVAILAPLGDLAMSAAKRSLGLKDMGSVLPGHGGFLDRIDGLLFVIPAAWVLYVWAGIL